MDKNTIAGIVVIFAILIGFSYLNKPSQEEIDAAKRKKDSVEQVDATRQQEKAVQQIQQHKPAKAENRQQPDSVQRGMNDGRYGVFAASATGEDKMITLENNLVKIKVSAKGGKIYSVELKNYETYDSLPLLLFSGEKNEFGLSFFANNRRIQTDELYFRPLTDQSAIVVGGPKVKRGKEGDESYNKENGGQSQTLKMRLPIATGGYLEYDYTLKYNSYMIGFAIHSVGLNKVISSQTNYLDFNWTQKAPRLERMSKYGEDRYTTIKYKYAGDEVDRLSPGKSSEESLKTKVRWISFKHLFFNSTLIADKSFPSAELKFNYTGKDTTSLGQFSADIAIPYNGTDKQDFGMQLYLGPNHYSTLRQYNLSLDQLINLGYWILRPVNRYLVIPVFNLLRTHIANFGIIILLLTLFIKLILFPFTYKSYISQAKMKALKPEIDELTAKYGKGKDKAMEKQQATMALYKKAGVNPMGGCLPMVLQMPILFAMFFFFPTSIELRQQSFLWAHDLSSYDSILHLPFTIPIYGDHVSMFCLLMTVTTIISTKLNSQATSNNSMAGMQTMMYLMPLMFLFILNSYPAGLSYYYFLANMITIIQMFLFRKFVDEDKIRAQLHAKKKKGGPAKKSRFQQKLEKMSKERGVPVPKR